MRLLICSIVLQIALIARAWFYNQTIGPLDGVGELTLSKRVNPEDSFLDAPPSHTCSYALTSTRRLTDHGFQRFQWVTGSLEKTDKLARSSAPHYDCQDSNQELTSDSVEYLRRMGVTNVISLNEFADSPAIKSVLRANKISYTPLPTDDYKPPSLVQLLKGYKSFNQATSGASLVWCGYGFGRSGAMVTAIKMFREAEKATPTRLSASDFKAEHVETKSQAAVLNKLQDYLDIGGVERGLTKALESQYEAERSFERFEKAKKSSEKSRAKVNCQNKLSGSTEALEEAVAALDIHWQTNRVLFDRILQTYTWPKKKDVIAKDTTALQTLDETIQNINTARRQPDAPRAVPKQTTAIDRALRTLITELESSRIKPSKSQVIPTKVEETIEKIEDHRRTLRAVYLGIYKDIKDLKEEIKDMTESVTDPEAIGRYKSAMRNAKAELINLKKEALETNNIQVISKCLQDATQSLKKAESAADTIAQTIKNSKKLTLKDFAEARDIIYEIRTGIAEIIAKEASQFIKDYIVQAWKDSESRPRSREVLIKEANHLSHLALYSQANAIRLGEGLQDKANKVSVINNLLEHPKLGELGLDAEVGVKSTSATWLQGLETAQDALSIERKVLETEINLTQEPIHAYVTTSLLIQQEAEITAAVLVQDSNAQDAEQKLIDSKQKGLKQLIKSLSQESEEEKEREAKIRASERRATLEQAAAAEEKSQHWKIGLALDIASAILAALPSPLAPIADALIWARQAIRISRFLRDYARNEAAIPTAIVTEAQRITSRIKKAMETWRTKVPHPTRDWASDKTPQQIIDSLSQIQEEDQFAEAGLAPPKTEETAGEVQHEAAETGGEAQDQAASNVEPQPSTSTGPNLLDMSLEELMHDLESIHVPEEEPGDKVLEKPLSKLLRKLVRGKVALKSPGKSSPGPRTKEEEPLRARRSIPDLRRELQEAALIPHHTSDQGFRRLLDDASWYLPEDCDLRPHSMSSCILQEIRGGAIAA
ncbi:hypothetical protein CDD81_5232 [Ophiocordyceps australis]|uniref:Swiss Army Knife protein DSP-PTPase phosphatase domain-containing protein n=1 Tax=Ophiocordyceps australis TaxID=1399860 RepID=A0A2C5YHD3_9HYPO|nr:hypothetical protein CDD81_5232 [Ophiocordyceps australis]